MNHCFIFLGLQLFIVFIKYLLIKHQEKNPDKPNCISNLSFGNELSSFRAWKLPNMEYEKILKCLWLQMILF